MARFEVPPEPSEVGSITLEQLKVAARAIVYPPELRNPRIVYQTYGRAFYEGEGGDR